MPKIQELQSVKPQRGKPLYQAARDSLRAAIDSGYFQPGEQMPNTAQLSKQLSVSLVTAHRALQELVQCGVLYRAQGKGTFVHERYQERQHLLGNCKIGLVMHRNASLADFYHSQILEGMRQAAHDFGININLLRFGEDVPVDCDGYLFMNPLNEEVEAFTSDTGNKHMVLVVGARFTGKNVHYVDVDNVGLATQAIDHLVDLGHKRIAFVGGPDKQSNNRDRWLGWVDACDRHGIEHHAKMVLKGEGWRLSDDERGRLIRMLSGGNRPTAIFAGGYYLALDAYSAAATAGLVVGRDVSIVGVDDPPSSAHLSPPMTTVRQPLVQLGHAALTALGEHFRNPSHPLHNQSLYAELVIRRSTGPAPH